MESRRFPRWISWWHLPLVFLSTVNSFENDESLRAILWGPGLRGDFALPVRFVFIRIETINGEKLSNVSKEDIHVEFREATATEAIKELQADLLYNGEQRANFLYRFRVRQSHTGDLRLRVFYRERLLASELIKGPILAEGCVCPSEIEAWLSENCPPTSQQIVDDLKPFQKVRPSHNRKVMETFYNEPYSVSLCNYVIKQNRIYRKCIGEYTGFSMFADAILSSLVRKVRLPDVDFIINLGDYPLARKTERRYSPQIPIFSWCGSVDTEDIVMPTYELVEATVHMMSRVSLDLFSVQDRAHQAYEDRLSSAFWRGRDSREERLHLVELSRKEPALLNASITNFFFFRDRMEQLGGKTPHVSFFKFFQHKLQINIDGTVAAYRLPFLLAGGSTVLKTHPTPYYEHFYHLLKENIHFISVKPDLSDLLDKIRYCLANGEICSRIAKNGQNLVNEHLLPNNVYCYHAQLLQEYARRTTESIEITEGMGAVDDGDREFCHCPQMEQTDNVPSKNEL